MKLYEPNDYKPTLKKTAFKRSYHIKDIKIAFKKWCESSVHFRYNSNNISKTIHNSNWNEFKNQLICIGKEF